MTYDSFYHLYQQLWAAISEVAFDPAAKRLFDQEFNELVDENDEGDYTWEAGVLIKYAGQFF